MFIVMDHPPSKGNQIVSLFQFQFHIIIIFFYTYCFDVFSCLTNSLRWRDTACQGFLYVVLAQIDL
jgi:hypothetical protein